MDSKVKSAESLAEMEPTKMAWAKFRDLHFDELVCISKYESDPSSCGDYSATGAWRWGEKVVVRDTYSDSWTGASYDRAWIYSDLACAVARNGWLSHVDDVMTTRG